jgi:hypothetical protein
MLTHSLARNTHQIRELLAAGCVDGAARLLGRPYRLVAAVAFGAAVLQRQQQQQQAQEQQAADEVPRDSGNPALGSGNGNGANAAGSLPTAFSTSSMDGSESEAAPLLLRDGGASALVSPEGLLNASPGAGRYLARVVVHPGAAPSDELLHLETACGLAASTSAAAADAPAKPAPAAAGLASDAELPNAAGAMSCSCVVLEGVAVQLSREGLLMPAAPLLRVLAGGSTGPNEAGSQGQQGHALVVVDFEGRLPDNA